MMDINLKLTLSEVNKILATLSKQPYEEVYTLIAKIREQGNDQIESGQVEPS